MAVPTDPLQIAVHHQVVAGAHQQRVVALHGGEAILHMNAAVAMHGEDLFVPGITTQERLAETDTARRAGGTVHFGR
jgi:hypothetical protein